MRQRYSYLDPDLIRQLLAQMGLRRLFNHLLLQSVGDVEEAMRWMRLLQQRGLIDENIDLDAFFAQLVDQNIIGEDTNGNMTLAAGGERQIRRDALDEIFGGLQKSMSGYHSVPTAGQGSERLTETRPYQFGDDPMSIDSIRSLQNAMKHNDPADDISITEDDLEVFETEHNSNCATVVMIDISHSMILYGEDRITPAKKVALALTELILTKYPKDSIDVLLFGVVAEEQHVDGVLRILRQDQLRQRQGHLLRRRDAVLAVEDHRVRDVDHDHGGAVGVVLGLEDLQVILANADFVGRIVVAHGVLDGTAGVDGHRVVAEVIRTR